MHLARKPFRQPFGQASEFYEFFGGRDATQIKSKRPRALDHPPASLVRIHTRILLPRGGQEIAFVRSPVYLYSRSPEARSNRLDSLVCLAYVVGSQLIYSNAIDQIEVPMKRTLAVAIVLCLVLQLPLFAGVGSDKTMYVGGTVDSLKPGVEGTSSATDEKVFVFAYKDGKFTVPYDQINDLEYGQKAGRRIGLAVTISPWLLFSKKRKHFMTIGFTDDKNKQQAAVFELGKNVVRVMLASMEARTGKKIEYQDDEARKSAKGN
jgi:hypothetical protein